jgi:hypothetical protein
MNKLFIVLMMLVLPSCGFLRPAAPPPLSLPPVKVITETVQLEIYQPPLPPEIQLDDVQWFVLTENNLEEKIAEIKRFTGADFVIFGMTPQSYENMAYNLQEIRRFTRQQAEIIKYYREATKPRGADGWMAENNNTEPTTVVTEPEQPTAVQPPAVEPPAQGWFRRLVPGI